MKFWLRFVSWAREYRFPLLLLAVFLAFNASVVFGGRTFLPIAPSFTTQPNQPYGYSGPLSQTLTTIDPAGSLNISYIFEVATSDQLKHLSLPFWNPYQALGQPLLANGISGVLSVFNLVSIFLSPGNLDWGYMLVWFLGTLFLYAYLRQLKLSQPASALGALSFMLSGLFQLYLPVREYPAVVAWLPLLMYAVERVRTQPDWMWRHAVLALGVYGTIAAGQPEAYVVSLLFILVYALARFLPHKNRFSFIWSALPGTLAGVLLSAPAWGTFYEYGLSAFSNHQDAVNIGASHLPWETWGAFLLPFVLGRGDLAPQMAGWMVGAVVFFVVVAVAVHWRWKSEQGKVVWILLISTLLLGAKIWGAPLIQQIGVLPILDRIIYTRYACFILNITLAALAAYGLDAFRTVSWKRWSVAMWVWVVVCTAALTVSFKLQWPAMQGATMLSGVVSSFLIFGVMGCIWLLALPVVWRWMWTKWSAQPAVWYSYVGFSLVLAAIPMSMSGYSFEDYAFITIDCFVVWGVASLVVGFAVSRFSLKPPTLITGVIVIFLVGIAGLQLTIQQLGQGGLSQRYNPLTTPPYISRLQELTQGGLYRAYSLDGNPQPNFSTPYKLSNLNNVEALMPVESAEFMLDYLDDSVSPIWFAGNYSFGRSVGSSAPAQFLANRAYFDLVAVRYLVTQQPLATVLYDTESISSDRQPAPLFVPLTAQVILPSDQVSGVQVLLSTYHKKNPGQAQLRVLDEDGAELRSVTIPGKDVLDDNLNTFTFDPLVGLEGQEVALEISFTPAEADSMIAAWPYVSRPDLGFSYRLVDSVSLPLVYTDETTHMLVYENVQALPRIFLATHTQLAGSSHQAHEALRQIIDPAQTVIIEERGAELTVDEAKVDPELEIIDFQLEHNSVEVKVNTNSTGILTLTDTYAPGWKVWVNDTSQTVLRVDGAFRGVKLDAPGEYVVRFEYRPPHWYVFLTVAGVGMLIVVGGSYLGWKRARTSI